MDCAAAASTQNTPTFFGNVAQKSVETLMEGSGQQGLNLGYT